jgi:hypothetical protein
MYAPVKTTGYRRALLAKSLLVSAAIAGATALAIGAVMAQTPVPKPNAATAPQPSPRALLGYQVRCWQHGRLLLEESLAQPPSDGLAQSIRLYGGPGSGGTYILFNSGTATCFVKPAGER